MIKLEVKLKGTELIRIIDTDNSIKIDDLCEYIIISINGKNIEQYYLSDLKNDKEYFHYEEDEYEDALLADEYLLNDLKLSVGDKLILEYNNFELEIKVIDINNQRNLDNFKVTEAKYFGIIENDYFATYTLYEKRSNTRKRQEVINHYMKKYKIEEFEYVDINKINNEIEEYHKTKEERFKEKSYEINASLDGFNKEIKRTIRVNGDITLDHFISMVIVAFNGDLSHLYGLRRNKISYSPDENYFIFSNPLSYIDLKEKDKFKIIYDYGDNWIINITIKKVLEKNKEADFQIIKGKGYGLVDDCGGTYGLSEIFSGNSSWYEDEDDYPKIDDFDLEYIKKELKKTFPNTQVK